MSNHNKLDQIYLQVVQTLPKKDQELVTRKLHVNQMTQPKMLQITNALHEDHLRSVRLVAMVNELSLHDETLLRIFTKFERLQDFLGQDVHLEWEDLTLKEMRWLVSFMVQLALLGLMHMEDMYDQQELPPLLHLFGGEITILQDGNVRHIRTCYSQEEPLYRALVEVH